MKIAADTVVSIDYVLTNDAGEVLDRSGDEPLAYLHGRENIVPGLEAALDGLSVGDATQAKLTPDQGYGERDDKKIRQISRTELPPGMEIEVGEALQGQDEDGNIFPLWVVKTDAESITLDGNHPLAGQNLNFDVTVREIRAATEEELHHGHVHGPGGHHHH
ncbi:MAG: peptidylprolyl isomerase [Myxococcales bacterium]|nr:peptidylprolyl isomerase [Myxococcales bacterium]